MVNNKYLPLHIFMMVLWAIALVISGIKPYDRATWVLEVLPVILIAPVLMYYYSSQPLSNILYIGIFLHGLVLIIGGAYTYARVPLGFDLAKFLNLERNPYDKIGHLFQGFVPALAAREVLLRGAYIRTSKMLCFVVICIVMMISSVYELLEWVAALIMGQGADEFLGTQGDEWDTQGDMFCALIGAVLAYVLCAKAQDRAIAKSMGS